MADISTTNLEFNWIGPWANSVRYYNRDSVTHKGSSYVCVRDGILNSEPSSTNTSDWKTIVRSPTPFLNAGDMLYNNGVGDTALPAGKAGQILQVSSGGLPVWKSSGDVIYTEQSGNILAKNSDDTFPTLYTGYYSGYPNTSNSYLSSGVTMHFTGFTANIDRFDIEANHWRNPFRHSTSYNGGWKARYATRTFEFTLSRSLCIYGIRWDHWYGGSQMVVYLDYHDGSTWHNITSRRNDGTSINYNFRSKHTKYRIRASGRGNYQDVIGALRFFTPNTSDLSGSPYPHNYNSNASTLTLTSSNTHNYKTDGLISNTSSKPHILVDAGQKIRETKFTGSTFEESIYTVSAGSIISKTVPSNGAYWYELID